MKRMNLKAIIALSLVAVLMLTACGQQSATLIDDAQETSIKSEGEGDKAVMPSGNAVTEDFFTRSADPSKNPQIAVDRKDTLVVGSEKFNGAFNPYFRSTQNDEDIIRQVFDDALTNDFDGNVVDNVCSYEIVSANEYKLTIKGDPVFHDGTPLTADDIKFGYMVVAHPDFDGIVNYDDYKIKGYSAYQKGEADDIEGIIVSEDKRSVTFYLEQPNVLFLYELTSFIIPKHYYAPDGKVDIAYIRELLTKPMGSGPFKFVDYTPGESATFEANAEYWGGKPNVNTLIFKVVPSSAELQSILTGDIDVMQINASVDNRAEVIKAGFIDLAITPTNGYGYVGMNPVKNPSLADVKVRQALAYAINRKDVVGAIYGDFAYVNNIVQSNVSPYYTEEGINKYEYDLDKAKAMLDEAGWKVGADGVREKDGKKFVISFTGMADNPIQEILVPEMIKDYKELGIDFKVEYVDWPTLADRVDSKEADMWFMAWTLRPSPDNANTFGTDRAQNHYAYSNPALDELYKKAYQETDKAKAKQVWAEIYKMINNDLPLIPIYQRSDMVAINARVKGMEISPYFTFAYALKNATIK